jgi:hypothetical protein
MRRAQRNRQILLATAVCAAGVPLTAAAWVSARTRALAANLGGAAGVTARIGAVDADLTGTIRLSDVALGTLVAADTVEASVSLGSLLSGALRADEIRVAGPRVAIQVDGDGDSDLGRVARRLAGHGRASAGDGGAGRLRRIVVSSGTLSAHIAGLGELSAERVELVPDAGGVRVITGAVRLEGQAGPVAVDLAFARSAAELALPHLRFGRVLAVGGSGELITHPELHPALLPTPGPGRPGQGRVRVRDVAIGRLSAGGSLELRGSVEDGGVARPLAIDVAPRDQAIAIRGDRIPLGAFAALAPHGIELASAHASGALAVRRDAARTQLEIDGSVDGVSIDHRVLAATPVPLTAAIHGTLAISPDAIAVSRASIELGERGAAHWTASGWLRRGIPASGQLDLTLAAAACSDLLASLPGELRGPLDGMVLAGTFGGRVRLTVDLAAPPAEGVSLTASITDDCRTEAEPPAADVARLAVPSDQVFADGSRARVGKGERSWIALRQMPPWLTSAFVSAEDARFYDHAGFDLTQIARSLEIDLREHRLARGGSTISQQLIKNAFLSQRRSFDRKLQEAILTWRLEARLDKKQILERYLNIIELGPRVFGVGAAARYWFDASPRELSLRQAAFLAALTSEPSSMSRRVRRVGGLDLESASRVDVVLYAMHRDGALDAAQLEAAMGSALHFAPAALKQER